MSLTIDMTHSSFFTISGAPSVQLLGGGGRGPDVPDLPAALRAADGHAVQPHLLPGLPQQLPQGQSNVSAGQEAGQRDDHLPIQFSAKEVCT